MAPLWMCEQTTPEIADSDVFNGKPLLRRPASTHGRPRESDRVRVGRELRVLVVDDQRDMADSFAGRVRRWGHDARMAHDGLAALRVAAAQHPDVVLLQMEMPFMDGHQIARHLRLDFPRKACFIIAVTPLPVALARSSTILLRRPSCACSQRIAASGTGVTNYHGN